MKAIDFLQCGECKKTLDAFLQQSGIEQDSDIGDVLAQFALFMELKRLRGNKVASYVLQKGETIVDPSVFKKPVEITC